MKLKNKKKSHTLQVAGLTLALLANLTVSVITSKEGAPSSTIFAEESTDTQMLTRLNKNVSVEFDDITWQLPGLESTQQKLSNMRSEISNKLPKDKESLEVILKAKLFLKQQDKELYSLIYQEDVEYLNLEIEIIQEKITEIELEEFRIAEEKRLAEEARKAEEARLAEEARKAAEAEKARIAAELEAEKALYTRGINLPHVSYVNTKMDYRAVTDRNSRQWAVLRSPNAHQVNGHRYYDKYPLVAVSGKFGKVGDIIKITWVDGSTLLAMIGDIKKSSELSHGIYHPDGSAVEFILDEFDTDANGNRIRTRPMPNLIKTFGLGVVRIDMRG